MTADLINLRTARKNKQRVEAEKRAEENRIKFGRTNAEKKTTAANKSIAEKVLEGHKRETEWPKT